jgi:exosortase
MTPTAVLNKTENQVSRFALLAPLWVGVLLVIIYGSTLVGIAGSWFDPNADMGHGLAVPLAAGFMAWTKRETLLELPKVPTAMGLWLVAWGAVQFVVSYAADWVFATRVSFLLSLTGCIWCLWGARVLWELAYPLVVLVSMIAPPTFLQERITFPLQLIASRLAETSLDFLGFSVLREGNILELVGERLAVAEACSGIRSLYSLFFFGLAYNFFFVQSTGIRWLLLLAITPLAIFGNALRIVATGVVGQYDRALAHGILHETWGYITVFLAGGLLVGLHLMLQRGQHLLENRRA